MIKIEVSRIHKLDGAGATNIAHLHLVRTGARYNGQVEILAGLIPGDRVVVSGADKLQDGQPLDVKPQAMDLPSGKEKERP